MWRAIHKMTDWLAPLPSPSPILKKAPRSTETRWGFQPVLWYLKNIRRDFQMIWNLHTFFTQADIIRDTYTRYHKIQPQGSLRYGVSKGSEVIFKTNLIRTRCWNQVYGCLLLARRKYDYGIEFIHQNMVLHVYRISRMYAYGTGICLLMKGTGIKL